MTRQRSELDALNSQLERCQRGARECGYDPLLDNDDLAPARGIIWALLAVACVVVALAMLLLPGAASGAEPGPRWRGVINVAAWHEYRHYYCAADQAFHDYRGLTPGLGIGADITDDVMASGGLWSNSHGNVSPYALVDWRPLHAGPFSFGLFAGVSGGYCRDGHAETVVPMGGATVRLDIDRVALHLLALPPTSYKPLTVGFAVSVAF